MPKVKIQMEENYCVVSAYADDMGELVNSVQTLLDKGWSLVGGLTGSNSILFQALNK